MNNFEIAMWAFNVANFLFLIGSTILIISVIRNRNVLKGYGATGPTLTLGALFCCSASYVLLKNWVSLLLLIPTMIYWALVVFYNIKIVLSRS